MKFEFATAGRIRFGPGVLAEVAPLVADLGRTALVVTGRTSARAEALAGRLAKVGVTTVIFNVAGEPTVTDVTRGVAVAKEHACDCVVAIGGGSAIDAAKAIAGLITNGNDPLDYLEVIGRGRALGLPAAPWVAIPTTAGTGAEVTRNAVLSSPEHQVKVSLRSPFLLPRHALVDPELTLGLPASLTATTGMDALTQLVEPWVSNRANPLTDGLCREGVRRVARSLRRAYEAGDDQGAREDMALASLFGGLALANAGLGAVHGFAGPLGGMFPAPHGAVCARLLPIVMEVNQRALRAREPAGEALARYDEVARALTGSAVARAADGVAWVRDLAADLSIPALRTYGVTRSHLAELVEKGSRASSMKANPIPLDSSELEEILERAL